MTSYPFQECFRVGFFFRFEFNIGTILQTLSFMFVTFTPTFFFPSDFSSAVK